MDDWKAGFNTKQEVFKWAESTRFFDPRRFKTEGLGATKVKLDRKMYAEFVQWAKAKGQEQATLQEAEEEEKKKARDEALVYFNKKEEFEALARERSARVRLKDVFNGSNVRNWTGLGEHWKGVKMIMDRVRQQAGGDEGVLRILDREGEEGVKEAVFKVRDELGLLTNVEYVAKLELEAVTDRMQTVAIAEGS